MNAVHFYENMIKNEEEKRIINRKIRNIEDDKIEQLSSNKTLFSIIPDRSEIYPLIKKIKFYNSKDKSIFYEINVNDSKNQNINFIFDQNSIWKEINYKNNEKFLSFKNYGSITNKGEILIRDEKNYF